MVEPLKTISQGYSKVPTSFSLISPLVILTKGKEKKILEDLLGKKKRQRLTGVCWRGESYWN